MADPVVCASCEYFSVSTKNKRPECHRYPPQGHLNPYTHQFDYEFPEVHPAQRVCGDAK